MIARETRKWRTPLCCSISVGFIACPVMGTCEGTVSNRGWLSQTVPDPLNRNELVVLMRCLEHEFELERTTESDKRLVESSRYICEQQQTK